MLFASTAAAVLLAAAPAWSQDQDGNTKEVPAETKTEAGAGEASSGDPAAADAAGQPTARDDGSPAAGETGAPAAGETGAPAAEGAATGADPADATEEESVLDDQTFEGDDEDFIPTEEIPVAAPIPFPADI